MRDPLNDFESVFTSGKLPRSKNQRSWFKWVVYTATLAAFAFGVFQAYSFVDARKVQDFSAEQASTPSGPVTVTVYNGDSATDVALALTAAGVVASDQAFLGAYTEAGSPSISPGRYLLPSALPAAQAVAAIMDSDNRQTVKVVVPEGFTVSQVKSRVMESMGFTSEQWDEAAKKAELPDWVPEDAPLEGLLFPATYTFTGAESALEVIDIMVARADAQAVQLASTVKKSGRSMYDTWIAASLVQAEVLPRDYGKAAAVVYNRLEADMPLGFDTTINYALGGPEDVVLTAEQLETDSPYNTYINEGLPPTPINNPGEQALAAAASPADGPWLYFVTVNLETGKTKFTDNYDTFLKYKKQLNKYRANNP